MRLCLTKRLYDVIHILFGKAEKNENLGTQKVWLELETKCHSQILVILFFFCQRTTLVKCNRDSDERDAEC